MESPELPPKLKLVPAESAAELARRAEREKLTVSRQREVELEQSLAPFRVGAVRYLNAAPLVRGIEGEVIVATPSQLGEMLRRDELDAALLSITEVLFTERYDILDGIAIASLGEVKSVFLAHRRPLEELTEVHVDPATLTSVNLLRVLFAERGLKPDFRPLKSYAAAPELDAVLLIGNPAIDFLMANRPHERMDLGAAWYDLTSLPFVFAVWALRRGIENASLRRQLREARDFGLDTLDSIIRNRSEYTQEFRQDYLGWHIHYHLGSDERRGIQKFTELLKKHNIGPVHEPRFVS